MIATLLYGIYLLLNVELAAGAGKCVVGAQVGRRANTEMYTVVLHYLVWYRLS